MSLRILALLLALLLVAVPVVNCAEDQDNDDDDLITAMTFLVEYEDQAENDLIEIGLLVEADDTSLKTALSEASRMVASITNIAESFCENNKGADDDYKCDEVVDVSDFEVEADYQKVRKELQFSKFIVSHEITVKVFATEKIGQLADSLLKAGVTKIESFEWVSEEEDDAEEGAIESGKEKAHDMCFHLGMKLNRIVSIEAVEEEKDEGKDEGDDEEEDEEEEEAPLVYRFNVECIIDETTAAKKAEEEAEEDRLEALEDEEDKKKKEDDEDEEEGDNQDNNDDDEEEEQEEEVKPKKKSKSKKEEEVKEVKEVKEEKKKSKKK